ncbi:NYN domain-containing protein [Raineyella fluvialis]|uniref:NYN domain-containing protein n=1 Tax=Raineyella fluvialis TaxID=2662261 RepID=A0A5Q2FIJ9_9ACTN|nr:NYN domain-containing protein [Raineyella fluvialis]QGF24993.1 NYN domain-containing protein [Raineyella fluvialis]
MVNGETLEARLAILIDADNASASHIEELVVEVAKYGKASVRRAYGDWTKPNLSGWKSTLLNHSIQPMQQFGNTSGKNSTDSAMIIDAMDLLYAGNLDGFCIVSSDSDFTRLAARIREQGLTVYGFGERKTPLAFVAACDTFIYIENLTVKPAPAADQVTTPWKRSSKLDKLLAEAVDAASADKGWAPLSAVGSNLSRLASDFDSRTWGYPKLSDLVQAHPDYVVLYGPNGGGAMKVRRK